MNKYILKRPLALLLAIVMFFSSWLAAAPAFAIPNGDSLVRVEGEGVLNELLGYGANHVLVETVVNQDYPNKFWAKVRLGYRPFFTWTDWLKFRVDFPDDSENAVMFTEFTSEGQFSARGPDYNFVLVGAEGDDFPKLGEGTLTVLSNDDPEVTGSISVDQGGSVSFNWKDHVSDDYAGTSTSKFDFSLNGNPIASQGDISQDSSNPDIFTYTHTGSNTDGIYITMNISDGVNSVSGNFDVDIQSNGAPAVSSPINISVVKGSSDNLVLDISAVTDPEDDSVQATDITNSSYGNPSLDSSGNVVYDHTGSDLTSDQFSFNVTDGINVVPVTVNVTVTEPTVNQPPNVSSTINISVVQGSSNNSVLLVSDVTDPENDSISFNSVSNSTQGNPSLDSSGNVVYQHTASNLDSDTFTFNVTDGTNTVPVTVNVTVTEPTLNQPPNVSSTINISVVQGSSNNSVLLVSDVTDPENDSISFNSVSNSTQGNPSLDSSGNVVYQHTASNLDSDTFTFNVTDGTNTVPVTVNVTVTEPTTNQPPNVSSPMNISVVQGSSDNSVLLVSDVTDPENDSISFNSVSNSTQGNPSLDSSGNVVYQHTASNLDSDTFTFNVTDGINTVVVTVNVTVTEPVVNQPPSYNGNAFAVNEGASDVLFDWRSFVTDPEDDALTLVNTVVPSLGSITGDDTDGFFYTHDGSDPVDGVDGTLSFTVSDGVNTVPIVVNLDVTDTSDELLAYDDTLVVLEDNRGYIDVVENDIVGNDFVEIRLTGLSPQHGNAWVSNNDGRYIVYEPDDDFVGTDSVSYIIEDSEGQTSEAVVTIDVKGKYNNLRYMNNDRMSTTEGNSVSKNLLKNDKFWSDVEFVLINKQPKHGTVTIDTNGVAVYQANPTYDGWDTFKYEVRLETGEVGVAHVNVFIGEEDKITLMDDVRSAWEGSTDNWYPILDNDIILAGAKWARPYGDDTTGDGPFNGTVRYEKMNGTWWAVYTPDPGYTGIDTFRYLVKDNDWWYDVASVIVHVVPTAHDNHDLRDYTRSIYLNQSTTIDVTDQLFPEEFDTSNLDVTAAYMSGHESDGLLTVNGPNVTFSPNGDLSNVKIRYDIKDQHGHMGYGVIDVKVYNYSTSSYLNIDDFTPIRINQYDDPEAVRDGVSYLPAQGHSIEYKYESILPTSGEHYYNHGAKDALGNPASIAYFFGDFTLEYRMKDTKESQELRVASKDVVVNGQPVIGLEPFDPYDVNLPNDYEILATDTDVMVVEEYFKNETFDILEYLYGFDYEDYRTDGETKISDQNIPEEMKLMFYIDMEGTWTGFDISEFWDKLIVGRLLSETGEEEVFEVPDGAYESGRNGEGIAYTKYRVRFSLTDTESIVVPDGYESELSDVLELVILNNDPIINGVDDFIVLEVGDTFDHMTGVTVEDPEDEAFANGTYALEDNIGVTIEDMSDGSSAVAVDTSEVGAYFLTYTYTDLHGETVSATSEVWVVTGPTITLDPMSMDIEPNGLFPVFNGVTVEWEPFDGMLMMNSVEHQPRQPDIEFDFRAYLGDETGPEIGALQQFAASGGITYVAKVRIWDEELDDWIVVTSMLFRTITVNASDMGDVVYVSDFFGEAEGIQTAVVEPEPEDDFGLYESYGIYPILVKYSPTNDAYRLVTAIDMDSMRPKNLIDNSEHEAFDDIAVTSTGDVYGLHDHSVYKLDKVTMTFNYLFNIEDEMDKVADDAVYGINYQSMTADESDHLVIAAGYTDILNPETTDVYDYDVAMLYFDPDAVADSSDDELTEVSLEPVYLVGLGLIDMGTVTVDETEYDYKPYDTITDIAYNSDLTALYGIGGYETDPMTHYPSSEGIGEDDLDSEESENFYQLFKLVEKEVTDDPLDYDVFFKYFEPVSTLNLDPGYSYKGLATLDADIYVTKFMMSQLDMGTIQDMDYQYLDTEVDRFRFDTGFVDQEDSDMIDGMFKGALGAASMFDKAFALTPASTSMSIGFTVSPADKIARFTATTTPAVAYGDITWMIVGNGTDYVINNNDGTFTIKDTVAASATVQIKAMALNKATGMIEELPGTININLTTPPPSTGGDSGGDTGGDTTPAAAPTPASTVSVALDTDAITLDYGETADPEFTSYDFTETVTGTTNTAVTWSLSDDTFVEVDENGVVTAKGDVPTETGDFTVTLTVTTVDGGATATATILFEEQVPLGAVAFFDPYISGYSDGSFKPKTVVTRAEVASMFAKILNMNLDFPGMQKFEDVSDAHWAYPQVQAMYRAGIFIGYYDAQGNRIFNPDAPITRAEIAQVFTNYWKFLGISVTGENTTPISDVPDTYWASAAINRIFNTGIVDGFDDGTFRPNEPTLREQIVSMINRLIERPPNNTPASSFTDILPTDEHYGDIEAASQTFLKPQGE